MTKLIRGQSEEDNKNVLALVTKTVNKHADKKTDLAQIISYKARKNSLSQNSTPSHSHVPLPSSSLTEPRNIPPKGMTISGNSPGMKNL